MSSKANAICDQRNAQITALPRSLANPWTGQAQAEQLRQVLAINAPPIAKLKALKPSGSDKAVWNQSLATNNSLTQILAQEQAAAQANDLAKFKQLDARAAPLAQKLHGYAVQLGLTECNKQPVPSK